MDDRILLGSQAFLTWAAILSVLGLIVIGWRTWTVRTDAISRYAAPFFKFLGLSLLAICLLEPLRSGQRARPGANLFVILADNSQSMTIKDPGEHQSRGEGLLRILSMDDDSWQLRLAQDFDLRRYLFDSKLQIAADFTGLQFMGTQSSLSGVLNNIKDRFRDRPLAGILLLTDGNTTDSKTTELSYSGLPPVYPVIIGAVNGRNTHSDLSISHLTTTTTAFEDAPVTIQADIHQTGLPNSKVTAEVVDESGAVMKRETQSFSGNREILPFRFQIRPAKPGVSFYEVRVRTDDESRRVTDSHSEKSNSNTQPILDPISIEATLENNRRMVSVERRHDKCRILYLSGRPNWEFKFLKRAIESDDQVQLTGVIRVAKKEPKFDWRSKVGEVSNPLFRGFDGKTEETERYDQPVLIRLNTKSPEELRDGFPKSAEELFEFYAIVIDDLEADFFTPDQLTLMERFVTERGGGLLMLGGTESFQQGGYQKTPIGRMMPFYLDAPSVGPASNGYRLNLTRDGWLQPWARLRSTETEEKQRLSELPLFHAVNKTGQVKPGATVIAEVIDSNGQAKPALAVQTFGRGRAAAMLIGDLWRWQIDRTDLQRDKDDQGKAWRQTIRWLIADVPDRIELRSIPNEELGQPLMRVEARIRTKEFSPQDNAAVQIQLQLPDGKVVAQTAEPSLKEPGLYESTFAARQTGFYRADVEVIDHEGQPLGKAQTGWTAHPAAEEFARVTPNVDFLQNLAIGTSGEVIQASDLPGFVRSLPNRKAPLTESFTTPLWHQPWVFLLIIVCLSAEWGLRRWKGLP